MATDDTLVQITQIEAIEKVLHQMEQTVGRALLEHRDALGLSLRDVASRVRLSYQGLSNIETGKSWRTATARRVAEYYSKLDAA